MGTEDEWASLNQIIRNNGGGLLTHNKHDLFRIIAAQVFDALLEIHAKGICLRSLNPHSILFDKNGLYIRLIPYPLAISIHDTIAHDGDYINEYISNTTAYPEVNVCIPKLPVFQSHNNNNNNKRNHNINEIWDMWSLGMVFYHLAFGHIFHHPVANTNSSPYEDYDFYMNASHDGVSAVLYSLLLEVSNNNNASNNNKDTIFQIDDIQNICHDEFLYFLIEKLTNPTISLTRIRNFRKLFCSENHHCGVSNAVMIKLFETICQRIFFSIRSGEGGIRQLNDILSKYTLKFRLFT